MKSNQVKYLKNDVTGFAKRSKWGPIHCLTPYGNWEATVCGILIHCPPWKHEEEIPYPELQMCKRCKVKVHEVTDESQ